MFEIPVEDLVFVVCTLVGGGLLLITVLVDDILGRHLRRAPHRLRHRRRLADAAAARLRLDVRRRRPVRDPGPRRPRRPGGRRRTLFGAAGFGVVYVLFSVDAPVRGRQAVLDARRSSAATPSSASASRPGSYGSVLVKAEGQTHEFSATAVGRHPGRDHRPGDRDRRDRPHRRADPGRRPAPAPPAGATEGGTDRG